ncbi:hypothetical protein ASE00_09265 [Sphingomonas sp. Root710]|uniref:hypothetical protein n=1 Tax=Sphingomonas sp. Root710 TaxID=1736594 RepID=UPI0006FBBE40|nr:hypothetical protein [Sphingomonas sp. Root710]KRB82267.1 hypothetical protein ASE00_09265 [Sphingomonas sp. Root710]
MSVRIILVLLALPLFLLLAGVNSLLLYREESRDMEAGLRGQALAAAVTVAEFAREAADPFADLAQRHRLAALHASTGNIPGLRALYLAQPGRAPLNLLDRPLITARKITAPARPEIIGTWEDAAGDPRISAIAPAGRGAMVVVDIDARPLARMTFHLKRLAVALVGGSAVLAILLGLVVGRRVSREFRRTRAIIAAHGADDDDDSLSIVEVRDLADAIQLIDKSVTDELARLEDKQLIAPGSAIAELRARHFPDISEHHGDAALSIRTLPGAAAGCFHVHQRCETGFLLAAGEIGGEPEQAFAAAVALRDFVGGGPVGQFGERLALAKKAFGVTRGGEPITLGDGVFALHGAQAAMAGYAARNPGLNADALTADLALLFPETGIIAAVTAV